MSNIIRIDIPNIEEIKKYFKKIPAQLTREVGIAVNKTVFEIEKEAKHEAPVNKGLGGGFKGYGGNLRQSIRGSMTGWASGKIEVGVDYGIYVHEGTRPHIIASHGNYPLRNKITGQIFGRKVNHPGTRANPFLQRAIDNKSKWIDDTFSKALDNALE